MTTLYNGYVIVRRPPSELPDVHEQPEGTFLGLVPPDAPVGGFGNLRHLRRQGEGTFRGDADRQREGSFGDHDLTDPERALEERYLRQPDAA